MSANLTYLVQTAGMEAVLASSTWLLRKTGIHNTDDTAATLLKIQ